MSNEIEHPVGVLIMAFVLCGANAFMADAHWRVLSYTLNGLLLFLSVLNLVLFNHSSRTSRRLKNVSSPGVIIGKDTTN